MNDWRSTRHRQPNGRAEWIGVLARTPRDELEAAWAELAEEVSFEWLRAPRIGLVMVRGRIGATGRPFNLGEMTVTDCMLRLTDGAVGYACVAGRDPRRAELAALFDALLQRKPGSRLDAAIALFRSKQDERRETASCKAASTKVEFFASNAERSGAP
ncbi:phosphonate C-P lyase system protein PhnG [Methylosinus sporium]|uniref:phosphonate C-P lyase system protein PhnG n=1 Tax=Methylosinus sporium TaxID=428 RepID=UPI001FCE494D|nr:phosphonate C-P lyase system protein PhnG [Methylosinus sporium]